MAGNSRDLTVNLVGKSDKLAGGLDASSGKSSSRFTAIGVAIGNLMSAGIQAGIQAAVQLGTAAVGHYFDSQDVTANLEASLGLTPDVAQRYGEIAGELYSQAWGDSLSDVGNTVAGIASTFGEGLGDAGLETLSSQALAFADIFDTDVNQAISSAGLLFKSGLVDSAEEGFDLLTRGMQEMPVALRGELLDATGEYSQFFGALGIDGTEAFGLLVDASKDGQYGIDKMGDAIKEFTIRATDGSALSGSAFEAMGLDMDGMSNRILAGGESARGAFDEIVTGLLGIQDPTEQANAAIALFGTPLEDLGTGEIPEFLQGLQSMDTELQNVEGSAQSAADTIGGTTRAKFEAFKRQAIDNLIEGAVKVIDYFKEFGVGGGIVKALGAVGGILVEKGKELLNGMWQGIQSVWDDPILPWLKSLPGKALAGLGALGGFLVDKGAELLNGLRQGALDVWNDSVFPWLKDLPSKALAAVPGLLDTLHSRGKQLLNGIRQGALDVWNTSVKPWLASIGSKALTAVPSLLNTLYSRGKQLLNGIRQGALDVWNNSVFPWLKGLPGKVWSAVPTLLYTLYWRGREVAAGLLNGARDGMWTAMAWAGGIGRAIVNAVGNLGGLLYQKGRELIGGFINGILDAARNIPIIGDLVPGFSGGGGSGRRNAGGGVKKYHDGGVVQGRFGQEVLAILQAGEEVVPIGGDRTSGGGGDMYVTVHMPPGSDGDDVLRALQQLQRRRGPLPLRVAAVG